jgi:hypothetical protein
MAKLPSTESMAANLQTLLAASMRTAFAEHSRTRGGRYDALADKVDALAKAAARPRTPPPKEPLLDKIMQRLVTLEGLPSFVQRLSENVQDMGRRIRIGVPGPGGRRADAEEDSSRASGSSEQAAPAPVPPSVSLSSSVSPIQLEEGFVTPPDPGAAIVPLSLRSHGHNKAAKAKARAEAWQAHCKAEAAAGRMLALKGSGGDVGCSQLLPVSRTEDNDSQLHITLGQHTQLELTLDEEEEASRATEPVRAPLAAPGSLFSRGRQRGRPLSADLGGMHLMAAAAEAEDDEWNKVVSGGRSAPPMNEFLPSMRSGDSLSCSPSPPPYRRTVAADAMDLDSSEEEEEEEEGEAPVAGLLADSELEAIYEQSRLKNFPPLPPTQRGSEGKAGSAARVSFKAKAAGGSSKGKAQRDATQEEAEENVRRDLRHIGGSAEQGEDDSIPLGRARSAVDVRRGVLVLGSPTQCSASQEQRDLGAAREARVERNKQAYIPNTAGEAGSAAAMSYTPLQLSRWPNMALQEAVMRAGAPRTRSAAAGRPRAAPRAASASRAQGGRAQASNVNAKAARTLGIRLSPSVAQRGRPAAGGRAAQAMFSDGGLPMGRGVPPPGRPTPVPASDGKATGRVGLMDLIED